MKLVYLDLYPDLIPNQPMEYKIKNDVQRSCIESSEMRHQFASEYILHVQEYGQGGKEHLGMKAQLWLPVDHQPGAAVIAFQGTNPQLSKISKDKNCGTGMLLNFDQEGRWMQEFIKEVFDHWIQTVKTSNRKLIITGHSLGGSLSLRLHAYIAKTYPEWALSHCDSIVFNSPGVDSPTAQILDDSHSHIHIYNAGDIFPHFFHHPRSKKTFKHPLLDRDRIGIFESLQSHSYAGLVALESKNVNPKVSKDLDQKSPRVLIRSKAAPRSVRKPNQVLSLVEQIRSNRICFPRSIRLFRRSECLLSNDFRVVDSDTLFEVEISTRLLNSVHPLPIKNVITLGDSVHPPAH
jgi:hypothetical protein